ncbi:MAG: hypothetical protein KJO08_08120 [Gammaproteobacteria bacterium]|nr:hypothetical protein [Gammaproteobacteria bacterium]
MTFSILPNPSIRQPPVRPTSRPEGMDYEHAGRGLIREGETPFPTNPLETLNRK